VILKRWMVEATDDFPAGVRSRLAQEYTAHWQESGGGDPVGLFGDPRTVRRQLGRLYLNTSQWRRLSRSREIAFWLAWPLLALRLDAVDIHSLSPALVYIGFIALLWGAIWYSSRRLPHVQRSYLRGSLGSAFLILIQMPLLAMSLTRPAIDVALIGLLLVLLGVQFWQTYLHSARLRRTLDLQTASPGDDEAPLTSPRFPAAAPSPHPRPRRSLPDRTRRSPRPVPTRPN
jgi:hypothetical protein